MNIQIKKNRGRKPVNCSSDGRDHHDCSYVSKLIGAVNDGSKLALSVWPLTSFKSFVIALAPLLHSTLTSRSPTLIPKTNSSFLLRAFSLGIACERLPFVSTLKVEETTGTLSTRKAKNETTQSKKISQPIFPPKETEKG